MSEQRTRRSESSAAAARPLHDELPPPPDEVVEMSFTAADLGALRHLLSAWAAGERLSAEPIEELVLAVNELATNSVRYGGGSGTMLLWREQATLHCEISDRGYIADPSIGRTRPAPEDPSGRGIWLVHQLCDAVHINSAPDGTAVRVLKHVR